MNITSSMSAYSETVCPEGRLDGNSADELEAYLRRVDPFIKEVVLDLSKLTYISSMGLRVILQEYKSLTKRRKKLVITNIPAAIRPVFEMGGFIQAFIADEKLVVVEKDDAGGFLSYSLGGILDAETAPALDAVIAKIDSSRAQRLEIDCGKLQSIRPEGYKALKKIDGSLREKNGALKLNDVPEHIVAESAGGEYGAFLRAVADKARTGHAAESHAGGARLYAFSGPWKNIALPAFNEEWARQNAPFTKAVLNLKEVTGIPAEGFAALMDIKKRCADLRIHLELVM